MASFCAFVSLLGRLLIGGIFLAGALWKLIPNFPAVADTLADSGIPSARLVLAGLVVLVLAGSTSVILGYMTRIGAGALIIYLCVATLHFHDFWNAWTQGGFQEDFTNFLESVALLGALLLLIGQGAGSLSFDGDRASSSMG